MTSLSITEKWRSSPWQRLNNLRREFRLKMSVTSKTGLLPTLKKKNVGHEIQRTVTLEFPKLVVPAPFTLKPFAGIYNPFPYRCSILCNHPADFEAKSIVKRAKDAWSAEGRSLLELEQLSMLRVEETENQPQARTPNEEKEENVPEELFRKYTDTDSRPVTPTPTLASIVTKSLKTRRCMTPDPTSFVPAKEKTLLVLDLRRSHSQETVYWQGGLLDDCNFENELTKEAVTRTTSPSTSSPTAKKKKSQKKKTGPPSANASSLKTETSKESESQVKPSGSLSPSKVSVTQEQEISVKSPEISSETALDDVVKRRGKKMKKGKKSGKGEKEFQGIPDPGETQVSALDNDSVEGNSGESPTGEEKLQENQSEGNLPSSEPKPEVEDNESFLTKDTLKRLQRQLDQEVVDSELNGKRKIALEEALRLKKNPKLVQQGEELKNLKKEFQLLIKDSEKWLSIPRVFTRRSARFELPMDSRVLSDLTPIEYVRKYVFPSPERIVLYNHVFNLHKEEPEDDEETERIMLGKNVTEALGKIMGRSMTLEEANEFKDLLNWKDEDRLDFRTFTGISATCERVLSPQFCSKMMSQKEDPRHEVEQADFKTLDEKLFRVKPHRHLVKILKSIRDV